MREIKMNYKTAIRINKRQISLDRPTYFIADIASNHDGDIERAKQLICHAKESGADAVKFQHFLAEKIVSDYGFTNLATKIGHQSGWKKSVFDTYKDYQCPRDWTKDLLHTARSAGIDFITTPYDTEAVDTFADAVPAFKIGSGDITWTEFIEYVAGKGKPVLLATGASSMTDVERAVAAVTRHHGNIALLQCNTNYTGERSNFRYINLNVLKSFSERYPGMVLGLSDHTPGHTTVLGAITLGARIIEKHFTDDNSREGPDHVFSMNPRTWKEMIEATRNLEAALGSGVKAIEGNEMDTQIIQRRCIRAAHKINAGTILSRADVEILRPNIKGAFQPYDIGSVLGKKIIMNKKHGQEILPSDLEW
jgi:N-acetylneuraminate synthase